MLSPRGGHHDIGLYVPLLAAALLAASLFGHCAAAGGAEGVGGGSITGTTLLGA